jgi:hypothetical protein
MSHLKLLIAKMKRERFGQSSERGRKLLDQLELSSRSSSERDRRRDRRRDGSTDDVGGERVGASQVGAGLIGRRWTYVRDDRPFGGSDASPAMIETAKLNGVGAQPWLANLLAGSTITRLLRSANSWPGSGLALPASIAPPDHGAELYLHRRPPVSAARAKLGGKQRAVGQFEL